MPFLPLIILSALALANLCVSAFLLWLSCKICRVRRGVPAPGEGAASGRIGISSKRALGVVVAWAFCGLLLLVALWFVVPLQVESSPWFALGALVFHVCLLLIFMRAFVAHSLGRAFLVGLLWQVFGILYTVGFVYVIGTTMTSGFAIPTGAMAPTLLGYHKDIRCPTCTFEFPINSSLEVEPSEGDRPSAIYACVCPNCRQHIHFPTAPAVYGRDNPTSIQIDDPGWNGGDRLLAGRGLLGAAIIKPKRFDVVMHQYPLTKTPLLYVKRLVGLPGETIAIQGGELYFLRADKGLRYEDAEAKQELEDPSQGKEQMHPNDAEALRRFEKGQFEILRKSPDQVLAMRHIVYDNDHPAKDQPARWRGDDGWKAGDDHSFEVHAGSAEHAVWLRYRHVLPDSDDKPALITDIAGYNTYRGGFHFMPLLGNNWVGDAILECEATLDNPQGELTLQLSRGVDRFHARWDLTTGTCTLLRVTEAGEQKLDSKPTGMSKKGDYLLRFANVDQRLVVWVNGDLPFGDGVNYPPPERSGPDQKNDLEPASIGAKGTTVAVHKLKLFRDTYYTVGGDRNDRPNDPDVPGINFTDPGTWRDLERSAAGHLLCAAGPVFRAGRQQRREFR